MVARAPEAWPGVRPLGDILDAESRKHNLTGRKYAGRFVALERVRGRENVWLCWDLKKHEVAMRSLDQLRRASEHYQVLNQRTVYQRPLPPTAERVKIARDAMTRVCHRLGCRVSDAMNMACRAKLAGDARACTVVVLRTEQEWPYGDIAGALQIAFRNSIGKMRERVRRNERLQRVVGDVVGSSGRNLESEHKVGTLRLAPCVDGAIFGDGGR
jgi:hypothetical protein